MNEVEILHNLIANEILAFETAYYTSPNVIYMSDACRGMLYDSIEMCGKSKDYGWVERYRGTPIRRMVAKGIRFAVAKEITAIQRDVDMRYKNTDALSVKEHTVWLEENRRPKSEIFVCSACGGTAYYPQPTRDKTWQKHCHYKYCPNCGAKMGVTK